MLKKHSGLESITKTLNEGSGLDLRYGICGNHAYIFLEMLKLMKIKARPVQFFYLDNGVTSSHIGVEVYYDDAWHYFDSTWTAYFEKEGKPYYPASVEEIRSGAKGRWVVNEAQPWVRSVTQKTNLHPLSFLKNDTSIIYNYDEGIIRFTDNSVSPENIDLAGTINYVGDSLDNGSFSGIRYQFPKRVEAYDLAITFSGVGGCTKPSKICYGDLCQTLDETTKSAQFVATKELELSVKSEDNVCYAVISTIALKK